MKLPAGNAKNYAILIGAAVAGVVVLTLFFKKQAKEAVTAAGGLISGNNGLTEGTPYEGAGIFGTLGAAFNTASGGLLQSIGEWGSDIAFDLFNKPYDPNNPNTPQLRKQSTYDAAKQPETSVTTNLR